MGHMGNGIQSAISKVMRACLPSKSGDRRSEAVALPMRELIPLSGKPHGLCGSPFLTLYWLIAGLSHSRVMGGSIYRCAVYLGSLAGQLMCRCPEHDVGVPG